MEKASSTATPTAAHIFAQHQEWYRKWKKILLCLGGVCIINLKRKSNLLKYVFNFKDTASYRKFNLRLYIEYYKVEHVV